MGVKHMSKAEKDFARELFNQGYSSAGISEKLNRSITSVNRVVRDLRLQNNARTYYGNTHQTGVTNRVLKFLSENCDKDGNMIVSNGEIAKAINGKIGTIGGVLESLKTKNYISVNKTLDDTGMFLIRSIHVNKHYENDEDEEGVDKIKTVSEPVDKWETIYQQNDAILVHLKRIIILLEEFNNKL